jgi:Osmosensitive K+ channel histidine kinase
VEKEITTSEKTVTRLMKLVDNLLDFRRLEKGSLELDLSRVDLLDIVREAAGPGRRRGRCQRIKVVVPNKSGIVQGDRDKLLQTVLNFLSNAIKFSPQNGTITISLRSSGSTVSVFVRARDRASLPNFKRKYSSRLNK